MSYGRRGGRIQVNMLQYMELVERVEKLEALIKPKEVEHIREDVSVMHPKGFSYPENEEENSDKEKNVLTKNKVMALLDEKGIKYNPRDKKDVLIELLNKEVETCQEDQTE